MLVAVGLKTLEHRYSADELRSFIRLCWKFGSTAMQTAQCVLPHTFKAPLSTPAKLIKWISLISLRPCRPRQDCQECWSLPREELSWISCGRLPLTTGCRASPQSLANRQDYLWGWVGGWGGWSRWVHSTMIRRKQRNLVNKWVQLKYKRFFLSDLFGLVSHFWGTIKNNKN